MDEIKIYDNKQIRSAWDNEKEEWYFSIVDVVGVLTESENPRKYWSVLKTRLKEEGSQLATNCSWLKMKATKEITNSTNPQGLEENKKVAKEGGSIAGDARKAIEERTGKPVITSKNAIDMSRLIEDVVKEVSDEKTSKDKK